MGRNCHQRGLEPRLRGPPLPKILYKIAQSLKFEEDCKIVTLPKQLLYVTRDVTCDHVICRPFQNTDTRKFTEEFSKLQRNGILRL